MNQSKSTQIPGREGGQALESDSGSPWSMGSCGPEMAGRMQACPCAGMLKKHHLVVGLTILSVILLVALATVAGSVLGTIAFVQAL